MLRSLLLGLAVVPLAASLMVLEGCSPTQPSRFYLLTFLPSPAAETQGAAAEHGLAIGIGPVQLPQHLDRPQIVTRTSQNEFHLAEFDRWAEPLKDNFTRALAENLSVLLSTDRVAVFPWPTATRLDYQVTVDVIRFIGRLGAGTSLTARWTLSEGDGERVLVMQKSSFTQRAGEDYEAMVSAQSGMLADLSREIATAINEKTHTPPSKLARGQITSLVVETPRAEEGKGAAPPEKGDKKKAKRWTSRLSLSYGGASGNTEEQSLRIGGRAARRTPATRRRFDAAYYGSSTDGEIDNNKFTSGIDHDWLLTESRWFLFTSGRYDFDEFESWEQRITAKAGPGYHLIERANLALDLRLGMGPKKEFGSENDDWQAEGLVGFDLDWKMTKRQSFDLTSGIFPIADDPGDFRTRTTADWAVKISDDLNLSLSAGVHHEYQSEVDPSKEKHDLRIFTGLQFGF